MISVDEARRAVLEAALRLPVEAVMLENAAGRVLAADVIAARAVPPAAVSAMDGYAVRAEELAPAAPGNPVRLPVSQRIPAGQAPAPLVPGTCARIFTGSLVPAGADAVVIQEKVVAGDGVATFEARPSAGENIRHAGEDIGAGAVAARAGAVLTPALLGVAASANQATVRVYRRPVVALVPTGDELRETGEPLEGPHQIVNSNGPAVAAAARAEGAVVRRFPALRDDPAETAAVVGDALRGADCVLLTGGVSVGEFDFVHEALAQQGVERVFWKVAQRPGKPLYLGRHGRTLVFGLPGNPVSALASYYMYVRPALRRMMGHEHPVPVRIRARAAHGMKGGENMTFLLRGQGAFGPDGRITVRAVDGQGSHQLAMMSQANGLIIVPPGVGPIAAGADVDFEAFGPEVLFGAG